MGEYTCGYCGETFRSGRPSCPHCGSDKATGWKNADEIEATSVDLGTMDDEAYDDFLEREGLAEPAAAPRQTWPLAIIGFIIVIISVCYILLAGQQ